MLYLDDVLGWLEQRSPARVAVEFVSGQNFSESDRTPWSLPLGGARASRSTGAWRLNKRK
jgi:hypothetical protein